MAEPWLSHGLAHQNSDSHCSGGILRFRRSMNNLSTLTSEIPKLKNLKHGILRQWRSIKILAAIKSQ